MDVQVSIRCSPNVKISKGDVRRIGSKCAKMFLDRGGRPGSCSNANSESVGGVEVFVLVDYHTNRLMTVTICTRDEALALESDVATDPGELADIASEAAYRHLPHDGQNRIERYED